MSGKLLIFSSVVALLLVSLVAPAPAADHRVDGPLTSGTATWSVQSNSGLVVSSFWLRPNGGCEDGGASGCPKPD